MAMLNRCQKCKSIMRPVTNHKRSMVRQLCSGILFLAGVIALFVYPVGTIAGGMLVIAAAKIGYSDKYVWKCPICGWLLM